MQKMMATCMQKDKIETIAMLSVRDEQILTAEGIVPLN